MDSTEGTQKGTVAGENQDSCCRMCDRDVKNLTEAKVLPCKHVLCTDCLNKNYMSKGPAGPTCMHCR